MTREQRIEAAARAMMSDWGSIDAPTEREIAYAFDRAKAVLTAAIPELMSDPPTGWVAPWEATEAMTAGMVESLYSQTDIDDDKHTGVLGIEAEVAWNAARDAYTKEQT